MRYLRAALLLALMLLPGRSFAAPVIYPVPEVIGFAAAGLDAKAPAFAAWLKEAGLPRLSSQFVAAVRKEFGPVVVEGIDPKNRHRALVASLHLVRASQYAVPKKLSGSTEYHLPITLSLVFTNPNTGDVLYSFTETSYAPVEVHDAEAQEEGARLLREASAGNYDKLVARLVHKASKGYNPAQIEASVAEVWKGLYILDKGSKFGIGRDDSLTDAAGNEIRVSYVTEDYAVAVPLLSGPVKKGERFSKFADQSLVKTVKKPKVLTMHDGWGDEQLKAVAGFFDSELSKESAFTLLPVNEGFSAVLGALAKGTDAGQFQVTNQRALPDYLIKFGASAPRSYQVTQEGKFGFQVYEQYVLGELLDKQGRIIYSAVAGDRIEEKDVAGMVFSREARLEILLKNAVKRLAGEFSKSIRFSRFTLPVASVSGNEVELRDEARQLRPGNNVQIFRNIGPVDGISGEVLVPTWLAEVREASGGVVRAELLLPLCNELKDVEVSRKDQVILEAISAASAAASPTSVNYCKGISPKLGSLQLDDFPVLSRGYGHLLPYSLYDNDADFFAKVAEAVRYGGFNKSTLKLGQVDTWGRCLQPVYKTAVESRQCEGGECDVTVSLATGYRLYLGNDKKGGAASETKVSIRQAREQSLDGVIQDEIDRHALGLLKDNIVKVQYR